MIILGGLYVWSIITALTAVCSRFWHFILVRGAEGLGETFYFPASMSLLSDYHDRSTRSRALSLHQTSVYAGTIAGSWLAGWMGQMFGWRLPFIVFGMGGVLLGLVLAMYIREPQRDEAERRLRAATDDTTSHPPMPWLQLLAEMARTPTVLALVLAFGGANFVALIFLGWAPTFLNEKFGMTLAEAGLKATLFIQVGSMVGSAAGGALADWARRYWPGGRISVQAVGLLLGAPFVYLSGESAQFALAAVAMSLFGFCKGLYDSNSWASLFDVIPPLRRGSVVGLMNLFGWLFGAAGPMVVGRAVDRGMTMSEAIASTGAIYLGASILLILAAILCAPRDIQRMQQGAARV
jgi:MFS family permease